MTVNDAFYVFASAPNMPENQKEALHFLYTEWHALRRLNDGHADLANVQAENDALRRRTHRLDRDNGVLRQCNFQLASTAGSDLLAELARLRAENETLAKLVERMAGKSVVWADDATPFTGQQVKALLVENEQLRRLNESLAERVAAQSELLTRKAEKGPAS